MYIYEDLAVLMVKERMDEARRFAQHRRAVRLARGLRPSPRVRLGMALVRFGCWLMGQSTSSVGTTVQLGQAQS